MHSQDAVSALKAQVIPKGRMPVVRLRLQRSCGIGPRIGPASYHKKSTYPPDMMVSMNSIITFTSDFGGQGHYTGEVKGAILSINPEARIVDLTHQVGAHNLLEAAYIISQSYKTFPAKTVHLVVVDPGVGSSRRAVIAEADHHYFVAPDNGILSLVYQQAELQRVVSIEAEHYYRRPVASTFHARDIFGPVASHMSMGLAINSFGPEISDHVKLALPASRETDPGKWEGFILHIDRFGNIITSLRPQEIHEACGGDFRVAGFTLQGKSVEKHVSHYAEGGEGEVFSLVSSGGYYEIASLKKSAAAALNVRRGMKVELRIE